MGSNAQDEILNVLTLGVGGVDVDTDPLLTADNAYRQAQNATFDPTSKRAGALIKRPGLDRFNNVPTTGPILGGIEAPFAGTAGAPASGGGGGGNPGDSGGTTDGQPSGSYGVGPGSSIPGSGSGSAGTGPSGASYFNGGTPLFGGKKLIVVGMSDGNTGTGWYVTSKGFGDAAITKVSTTPPHLPTRLDRFAGACNPAYVLGQTANHDQVVGIPPSVTEGLFARPNGVLFYPQSINPAETTGSVVVPIIRRNDGTTDVAVASIPNNPSWGATPYATGHGMQVVGMGTKYGDGSNIYICVHDLLGVGGTTITNDGFRLFRLNVGTSALTEIFNTNPLTGTNYNAMTGTASPFLSGGGVEAWFGGVNEATGVSSTVFSLVPSPGFNDGYANWKGYEGVYAVKGDVTCMAVFQGQLFVGHSNMAASAAYAVINANALNSGITQPFPAFTATDGTSAQAPNGFVSMAIFLGALYVSYFNPVESSLIYKYDGTSWTTAFTVTAGVKAPMNLHVDSDGDTIYAFGTTQGLATPSWYSSTDGATWTNRATNMNVASRFPMNVFMDFTQ